ncbi:MAG TPA: imelysin family protein [Candidatus Kapabacteria bacterium]
MKQFVSLLFIGAILTFSTIGCDSTEEPTESDEIKVLTNIGNNIILEIYQDLDDDSDPLITAVQALRASQTQTTLDAARQAWKNSRIPFEFGEAHEFGPVKQGDVKKKLDFWPTDINAINAITSGTEVINQAFVDARPYEAKGYHGMEYLLWGQDAETPRLPGSFLPRELEYLEALAVDHKLLAEWVNNEWSPEGGNYVKNLTKAGTSESVYVTELAGVQQVVDRLTRISEEVGKEYLGGPLDAQDPRRLESYFSNSSGDDFYNILLGIQAVYTGVYGVSTDNGISKLMRNKKADLDDSVKTKITECLTNYGKIRVDLNNHVSIKSADASAARTSGEQLHRIFEDRVKVVLYNN